MAKEMNYKQWLFLAALVIVTVGSLVSVGLPMLMFAGFLGVALALVNITSKETEKVLLAGVVLGVAGGLSVLAGMIGTVGQLGIFKPLLTNWGAFILLIAVTTAFKTVFLASKD